MIPGSIDEEYINIIESTFLETKERKSVLASLHTMIRQYLTLHN